MVLAYCPLWPGWDLRDLASLGVLGWQPVTTIYPTVEGSLTILKGKIVFLLNMLLCWWGCLATCSRRACIPIWLTTVIHESPLFVQKQEEFLHNLPEGLFSGDPNTWHPQSNLSNLLSSSKWKNLLSLIWHSGLSFVELACQRSWACQDVEGIKKWRLGEEDRGLWVSSCRVSF